jgi:hypothetical protein
MSAFLLKNRVVFRIEEPVFQGQTTLFGRATDEIRTRDLTITNRLLYQLSHGGDLFSGGDYKGLHLFVQGNIILHPP